MNIFSQNSIIIFLLILYGCSESENISVIQNKIQSGNIISGYKPFDDPKIKEICLLSDGTYEGRFLDDLRYEIKPRYGFLTILIRKDSNYYFSYLDSNLVFHPWRTNYCTDMPEKIILKKDEKTKRWAFVN